MFFYQFNLVSIQIASLLIEHVACKLYNLQKHDFEEVKVQYFVLVCQK